MISCLLTLELQDLLPGCEVVAISGIYKLFTRAMANLGIASGNGGVVG